MDSIAPGDPSAMTLGGKQDQQTRNHGPALGGRIEAARGVRTFAANALTY